MMGNERSPVTQPARPSESGSRRLWRGGPISPSLYAEMRTLARGLLALYPGRIANSSSLVHEAVYKLRNYSWSHWDCRKHFLMASRQTMRQVLHDRFRRSGRYRYDSLDRAVNVCDPDRLLVDMLTLKEGIQRLERADPKLGAIVLCKMLEGLNDAETAKKLRISERTVQRKWKFAKAYLKCQLSTNGESTFRPHSAEDH